MHASTKRFLTAALAGIALSSTAFAQERPRDTELDGPAAHRERVRARYDAETWPRGVLRQGLPIDLQLEGWSADPLRRSDQLLLRSFRRAGAAQPSFILEFIVTESVRNSHDELLTWLAGVQSPERKPTTSDFGVDVGDIGYVGRSGAGPRAVSWIAFVRGNVAVRLVAMDPRREPELDLGQIGRRVDAAIVARKALPEGAKLDRPRIDALSADRSTVIAGEQVRLNLDVIDPAQGQPFIEYAVAGQGQGYVEREPDGFHYLHTTGPGPIVVTAAVTSSTGVVAERSIDIRVMDER